jgi:hypothetical protein
MRAMERLATRAGYIGNSTKRIIIEVNLNLTYSDWNGNTCCNIGTHAFI